MKRGRSAAEGPSAIELIEEAVHVLRRAPMGALAVYLTGTAPFVFGIVFFWARTTWFQPGEAALAGGALVLVGLFVMMKTAQAEFCARLLAFRMGTDAPPLTWQRVLRVAVAQSRVQPWGLFVLPVALVLSVPFGWAYAFFQNATIAGDKEPLGAIAARQAKLWPAQNHLGLLFICVLGGAAWINIAAAFWVVPWLANRLLGLQNLFGFSGWWFLNTTFLVSTLAMTWLAIDPLVKTFYTLRVFYGEARRNGEDIQVELRLVQRSRTGGVRAALALAVILPWWPVNRVTADERRSGETVSTVQPAALDQAIDEALNDSVFSWRLRPVPERTATEADDGLF
ncbi:MAG TPA: hypothetical protein VEA63_01095, partial [Opitutus sp.]|nr:hypothetical protein [Opitutus sp.]